MGVVDKPTHLCLVIYSVHCCLQYPMPASLQPHCYHCLQFPVPAGSNPTKSSCLRSYFTLRHAKNLSKSMPCCHGYLQTRVAQGPTL